MKYTLEIENDLIECFSVITEELFNYYSVSLKPQDTVEMQECILIGTINIMNEILPIGDKVRNKRTLICFALSCFQISLKYVADWDWLDDLPCYIPSLLCLMWYSGDESSSYDPEDLNRMEVKILKILNWSLKREWFYDDNQVSND
jgi:hypothetical protein